MRSAQNYHPGEYVCGHVTVDVVTINEKKNATKVTKTVLMYTPVVNGD